MPVMLGMLFLICVVGIIISTANSFLLIQATTFIKDIYLNFINKEIDENDANNFMVSENYKQEAIDLGWYDPASGKPFTYTSY